MSKGAGTSDLIAECRRTEDTSAAFRGLAQCAVPEREFQIETNLSLILAPADDALAAEICDGAGGRSPPDTREHPPFGHGHWTSRPFPA